MNFSSSFVAIIICYFIFQSVLETQISLKPKKVNDAAVESESLRMVVPFFSTDQMSSPYDSILQKSELAKQLQSIFER